MVVTGGGGGHALMSQLWHQALWRMGEPGRDAAPLTEELLEAAFYKQIPTMH